MPWKCPCCGYEDNADESPHCAGGCGYTRLPQALILTSTVTGQEIRMSVDTTVGKYLLRSFAGDDAVFASEPQFKIYKDLAAGCWSIQHLDGAKNPTFCDGADITGGPVPLKNGTVVSIGPERMKLTIRLVD